jgi:hypothetical protein
MPLGEHLGRSDQQHLARWHAALMAGRRAAPKCDAFTREGRPCRRDRLYGANFCGHHIRGVERDSLDAVRRERLHRELARTSSAGQQSRIERQLRNIEKRSLHRAWLRDPTLEGSTIDISAVDDRCVQACLRDELGIDIERPDRVTGRELSARAVDRAKWAGYLLLQGTLDHEVARRRIAGLLRDERTYWARLAPP